MSADAAELGALAAEAALRAGELLRGRFEAGRETHVSTKSTPTDPVSEADLASQHAIRALLEERRPGDGFLGEEEGVDQDGSSGLRWIVDPLDGTVNFLYGIPQWAVSVAVADAQGTVAGVVHDPMRGETFRGVRGQRATLNGREIVARGAPSLERSLIATGFAYDARLRAEQGAVVARLLPRVRDIRRPGSAALDLAWLAVRRYDAYYERGVKPWDTAAGVLVCECAGLRSRRVGDALLVAPEPLLAEIAELIAF